MQSIAFISTHHSPENARAQRPSLLDAVTGVILPCLETRRLRASAELKQFSDSAWVENGVTRADLARASVGA